MTRVLVTGASGFIGRNAVAPLVERGFEVHGVGRRRSADLPGEVVWHEADLLTAEDRAAVVGKVQASHLLHLAWYSEPGRFWAAPENLGWVGATVELLQAFAAAGGRRAVLAGTCAEYDWEVAGRCVENETPLRPVTLYGICKDATRRVCEGLADGPELDVAWGRIFFLYGPGEHPDRLVASVARALVRGDRAPTSEGRQIRDFMHVADVAAAFAAITASDVTGSVNVGSGTGVAVRDLARAIATAAGGEDRLDLGAMPPRPGEPAELVADVNRLRDEVGYLPAITLSAGVADTVGWWRTQEGV